MKDDPDINDTHRDKGRDAACDRADQAQHWEDSERHDHEPYIRWTIPRMVYRDGADIPRREFLYGYAYARGFVTANIGDGGVGKSIELIAELLALASGKNLLGIMPCERVPVGYWNGDDPYVEVERRIHAVCQHYGIDLKALIDEGWLYIGTRDQQPLCIASTGRLGTGPIINQDTVGDIEAFIREYDIGLMALDPLKSLHRVPENSNTDMDIIGDIFNVIAERTGAAIALTHHIRKPAFGQNEATTADARGATALINKVRLSRVFNVMTTQLAIAAHIKEENRRSHFRVDSGKANIAPPEKATWFKIIPVPCANGEDTPTVVSWTYPSVFDQVTPDHVARIRTIAASGSYRKDSRSADWIGRPVAEMLDLDLEDEADRKQLKQILKTWFANRVLATKEGQDDNRNKRLFVVPGTWTGEERTAPAANDLTALARLLAEWKKAIGIEQTSLDQVIKIAANHPSLKAALLDVAAMDDGQTISNVQLARWLRNFNEVPVGGLQLSGGGIEDGSPLWRLQAAGDDGGIAFLITKKMRAQLRDEHGLSDEQIFNLKPQQAHFILAKGGHPVTKWGVTFIVSGPAGADATCLYCHSAEPDTTGGVVHTDYGTLHEECAAAFVSDQDKAG